MGGSVRLHPLTQGGEVPPQLSQEFHDERGKRSTALRCRWYVVRTCPRHEKRVAEELKARRIEAFLPLYDTVRSWKNGCKVTVRLPLFPGYVFVRIDPHDRFAVLSLPGMLSFVGSASGPWPLPDQEMAALQETLQSRKFEPHPYLAVGRKVRVKSGPLCDFTGFLVRHAGELRVVISVELIQRAVAVEVEADDLEAIGTA